MAQSKIAGWSRNATGFHQVDLRWVAANVYEPGGEKVSRTVASRMSSQTGSQFLFYPIKCLCRVGALGDMDTCWYGFPGTWLIYIKY